MRRPSAPRGGRWLALALVAVALLGGCRAPTPVEPAAVPAPERRLIVMVPARDAAARDAVVTRLVADYPLTVVDRGPFPSIGMHGLVCEVDGEHDPATVRDRLAGDPRVALVEPWRRFELRSRRPDDALAAAQANLVAMRVPAAHHLATGRGVRVAIVDSAVDRGHPEFAERIVLARDFVADGPTPAAEPHGTATAGLIAASAGNGIGIVGVAPAAELVTLRGCSEAPPGPPGCSNFALARAIDFAVRQRVDVLNLSLVGGYDALVARVVERALDADIIVVASAGDDAEAAFPANLRGVIAAGAEGAAGRDLVRAPATDVLVTVPGGGFDFASGSSVAAAQIAGVGALLRERVPGLGPAAADALLRRAQATASHGRFVDACLALGFAAAPRRGWEPGRCAVDQRRADGR